MSDLDNSPLSKTKEWSEDCVNSRGLSILPAPRIFAAASIAFWGVSVGLFVLIFEEIAGINL
ncbi:MAG TPA: hypothetical protein PKD40_10490, partial [Saprospiraceae bacterium]|nr:hypothetical protein [Saprospiraceae bacterium]